MILRDRQGLRYGRLLVRAQATNIGTATRWSCLCDCGNTVIARSGDLTSGDTKSCGCLRQTHGKSQSNEFRIWWGMLDRCSNPRRREYPNYGGRGIKVCESWRNSFELFFIDMGPRPSPKHSIDRYPDNNGNYEPGNCRWATRLEQMQNARSCRIIEYKGVRLSLSAWAREAGLPLNTLRDRIVRGWDLERALKETGR